METALAIILISIAVVSIIVTASSKKWLAPLLIIFGLIGLYMSTIQINVKFSIIFLSFSLALIASGIIIIIANAKFKRA
jgi:hypothetical protein